MFWCISYRFGAFATIWLPCETRAKRSELVQKLVPRSRIGIFRNESTRSNPWDPKLKFWCILCHLDPFGTVRLPYETQGKTGRTSAKDRATKLSRIFFTTNTPNPLHWTLNSCFGALHSVFVHLGSFRNYMKLDAKQGQLVQLMRKFLPRSHVSLRTHPIHPIGP